MANSIQIRFDTKPDVDDVLRINITIGSASLSFAQQFKETRTLAKKTDRATSGTINDTAFNFAYAMNLDYANSGGAGNVSVVAVDNVVTVTIQDENYQIQFISAQATEHVTVLDITNNPAPTPKSITIVYSPGSSVCSNVSVNIEAEGGTAPYKLYQNGSLVDASFDPDTDIEVNRGSNQAFRVLDSLDVLIGEQSVEIPRILQGQYFNVLLVPTNEGTTATVVNQAVVSGTTPVEYSLNGIDYSESTGFSGLANGQHTLYIKDVFGCVTTKIFFVTQGVEAPGNDFDFFPEENAFRFFKKETGNSIVRNYYNSRACEQNVFGVAYGEIQPVQLKDLNTIQFQSNYTTNEITLIKDDGNEESIPVIEKVTHFQIFDSRDASLKRISGQTAIVFEGGNTYDELEQINGESDLNGVLPDFFVKGLLVEAGDYGLREIVDIRHNDFGGYMMAILDFNLPVSSEDVILKTIWNRHNFNVYEFQIDMTGRSGECFKLEYYNGFTYKHTEWIQVYDDLSSGLALKYRNTKNKQNLNYQTGIEHLVRLKRGEAELFGAPPDLDIVTYDTDISSDQIKADFFKNFELTLENQSYAKIIKVGLALTHNILDINNVQLTTQSIEFERLGKSNRWNLVAKLREGGNLLQDELNQAINEATVNAIIINEDDGSLLLWQG